MFFVAKICKRALRASIEGYLAVAASTPTYSSYKDCDFQFMKNKVKVIAPGINLMPPWLTDDLNNVTSKPVRFSSFVSYQLGRLFLGIANSDCPLPCTTISTEAKITDKFEHVQPGFILQFQQTVEVRLLNEIQSFVSF